MKIPKRHQAAQRRIHIEWNRHIDLHETLKMRQSIIRHTAETFEPDIFIIDKEPLGLRGEIEDTRAYLKTRGTTLILGLRDVMDAPHLLEAEWQAPRCSSQSASFTMMSGFTARRISMIR